MIRQLMGLCNVASKEVDLDRLAKSLGDLERWRDTVMHGIWIRGPKDEFLLQSLSGNWVPDPKAGKVSRRIKPEGVLFAATDLTDMAKLIATATQAVRLLGREIESALGPSRQKSREQSQPDHPQDDSNSGKSGHQPRSSSG